MECEVSAERLRNPQWPVQAQPKAHNVDSGLPRHCGGLVDFHGCTCPLDVLLIFYLSIDGIHCEEVQLQHFQLVASTFIA